MSARCIVSMVFFANSGEFTSITLN